MAQNNKSYIFKLKNTINKLDKKFDINHGGCCFIAYCIAKYCEEKKIKYRCCVSNYRCKIDEILACNDTESHQKIKNIFCKDKTKINNFDCRLFCRWFGVNHFFVKINNTAINQWIIKDYIEIDLNSKQLFELYNKATWNECFDKNCIGIIENEIQKCFK